ncbi:MAG: trypsin-like serine protease [Burkholderiaceae bacterium]
MAITSRNQDGSHSIECSATLISPKHVLTAGHCLDLPGLLTGQPDAVGKVGIYIGSGQEGGKVDQVLPVAAVHVHPSLRLHPGGNADIAVITMKDPVRGIRPTAIHIPPSSSYRSPQDPGSSTGW